MTATDQTIDSRSPYATQACLPLETLRERVHVAEKLYRASEQSFADSIKELLEAEAAQAKKAFVDQNKKEINQKAQKEQDFAKFLEELAEMAEEDSEYEDLLRENRDLKKRMEHLESRMLTLETLVQRNQVVFVKESRPVPPNPQPFNPPFIPYCTSTTKL